MCESDAQRYLTHPRDCFGPSKPDGPNFPRLELWGDDGSLCGAVPAVTHVSYKSYPIGNSDGAISPKLGSSLHSRNAGSPDQSTPPEFDGDHMVYGATTTLFPEHLNSQMNNRYYVVTSPLSFGYDLTQGIGLYTPCGQGLIDDLRSITGAGLPLERISCVDGDCRSTFTRTADLDRHVLHVHNRFGHHCQVQGCSNNKGNGYCRPDKLKEHMWKKHGLVANLSYTKVLPASIDEFE